MKALEAGGQCSRVISHAAIGELAKGERNKLTNALRQPLMIFSPHYWLMIRSFFLSCFPLFPPTAFLSRQNEDASSRALFVCRHVLSAPTYGILTCRSMSPSELMSISPRCCVLKWFSETLKTDQDKSWDTARSSLFLSGCNTDCLSSVMWC